MNERALEDPALRIAATVADDFEGLSLTPYWCPGGFPTIGYGHLLSRQVGAPLEQWQPLSSEEEAHILLQKDMVKALLSVWRLIKIPLNDNQEAAVADFAFNCGAGNLQASTLRKVINRGDFDEVPFQLDRWVYAGGRKLRGLVRRRRMEGELFMA